MALGGNEPGIGVGGAPCSLLKMCKITFKVALTPTLWRLFFFENSMADGEDPGEGKRE